MAAILKQYMKKAFSLIETIIVVVLLGVFATIVVSFYPNLRRTAERIMLEQDLLVLRDSMEAFKGMGGDLKTLALANCSTADKAAALTTLLDGTTSLRALRTEKGAVGNLLPSDSCVVPSTENGEKRLIMGNDGKLSLATSGQGFTVAKKKTYVSATVINSANVAALVSAVATVDQNGNKYADQVKYLWDEDTRVYAGPAGGANYSTPGVTAPVLVAGTYTDSFSITVDKVAAMLDFWMLSDSTKSMQPVLSAVNINAFALYQAIKDLSGDTTLGYATYTDTGAAMNGVVIYDDRNYPTQTDAQKAQIFKAASAITVAGGHNNGGQITALYGIGGTTTWRDDACHVMLVMGDDSPPSTALVNSLVSPKGGLTNLINSKKIVVCGIEYDSNSQCTDGLGAVTINVCNNSGGTVISQEMPNTNLDNYMRYAVDPVRSLSASDVQKILSIYDAGGAIILSKDDLKILMPATTIGTAVVKYASFKSFLDSVINSETGSYLDWDTFKNSFEINGYTAAAAAATTAATAARTAVNAKLNQALAVAEDDVDDQDIIHWFTCRFIRLGNAIAILQDMRDAFKKVEADYRLLYPGMATLSPSADDFYNTAYTAINALSKQKIGSYNDYVRSTSVETYLEIFCISYRAALGTALYNAVYAATLGDYAYMQQALVTAQAALSGDVSFTQGIQRMDLLKNATPRACEKAVYADLATFISLLEGYAPISAGTLDIVGDVVSAISGIIKNAYDEYSKVSLDFSNMPTALSVAYGGDYTGTYSRGDSETFSFDLTFSGPAGTYNFDIPVMVDSILYTVIHRNITLE